jgi:hypothetical protein
MPGNAYSYNGLIAALQSHVEDDSAEFIAEIPNIVAGAESMLVTDLDLEIYHNINPGSLAVGVFSQAIKSAGWCGTRSIHLQAVGPTGPFFQVYRRTYEYCIEFAPDNAAPQRSRPLYFAEYSPTNVWMSPAPDVAYVFTHREIAMVTAQRLAVANQNTWLGTNAGDLLLLAAQQLSHIFLKSEPSDLKMVAEQYQRELMPRGFEIRRSMRADYSPIKPAANTGGTGT